MLCSLMSPVFLNTMLTMLYMGPVRIRFTTSTSARMNATQEVPRTRPRAGFLILTAAMVTMMASTRQIPIAIRWFCSRPSVVSTSFMLIPSMFAPPSVLHFCMKTCDFYFIIHETIILRNCHL